MNNVLTFSGIKVPIGTHEGKRVIIGSDHRGYPYKKNLGGTLANWGYNILDVGTYSDDISNYPIIAYDIGKLVSEDKKFNTVGIGICASGNGIAIPSGKCKGVYVARCLEPEEAINSRVHNNANFLALSAEYSTEIRPPLVID